MRATRPAAAAIAAALALAACTEPVPPDKQDPPEPQAQARAPQATGLRDTIHVPIDKARAVDAQVQDAAQQQRDAIEAQTGG